jgi:hypothetical protein
MIYGTYIEAKLGTKALRHPIIRRMAKGREADSYKRKSLADQRRANAPHYRSGCGRAMIWPPIPGTHFHDDVIATWG